MALTLLEEPNLWQPVYNPIIYRYSSDLSSQTNFEIKIDIQIQKIDPNTADWTALESIAELSQPPAPDGTVTFDIHKYLANELTSVHNLDNPNKIVEGLKSGQQMLRYKVVPYETYTSTLSWQFNRIVQYSDGGVLRPSFDAVAPLTDTHSFNSYVGSTFQVTLAAGNPVNESFDGTIYTVVDSADTLKVRSLSGTWVETATTTYTVDGTSNLTSSINISTAGTASTLNSTWNGVMTHKDFIDWLKPNGEGLLVTDPNYEFDEVLPRDGYFYRVNASTSATMKLLTTIPFTGFGVMAHDYVWLQVNLGVSVTDYTEIQTDNGIFAYNNSLDLTNPISHRTNLSLGVGPANLSGTTPSLVLSGALPVIDSDTTFIKVRLTNGTLNVSGYGSEQYVIDVKSPCTIYPVGSVLFLDTFGSYIPINFYMKKKENVSIERINYVKNYGSPLTDFNGNDRWNYNTFDAGKTNIDTTYKEVFTITTDWLTDAESTLMQNLLLSPDTYFVDENSEAVSINILTSSFERKNTLNDQLFNYTLTFENSNKNRMNG